MFDPNIIKETYAGLPDEKLITLVKNDGAEVTYEAFILLKREYAKRKLDPKLITEIEKLRQEQIKEKINENFQREHHNVNEQYWRKIFWQKAEGKKNEEIRDWLVKEGVEIKTASIAIANLSDVVRKSYQRAQRAMFINFVLLLLGIILFSAGISLPGILQYTWPGIIMILGGLKYLTANHRIFKLAQNAMIAIEKEEEANRL